MRGVWLALVAVVPPGLAWAEAPTPLDAPLAAGAVTMIAAAHSGPAVPRWTAGRPFHYRLYLPDDYHDHERKYPVMFIAGPRGNATMGPLAERLARDRWIVAMLVESRNGSNLWLPNFIAAHDDVVRRVRVQPDMLFCTGVSGAAKVCSVYPEQRSGFRGVIAQAAGLWNPRMFADPVHARLVVFGTFGAMDPNLRFARQIRAATPPGQGLVEVWDGGHGWAPAPVMERALDWVEDRVFLDAGYDPALADAYRWYFENRLAAAERAGSDAERTLRADVLRDLPARWRLDLDAETRARLAALPRNVDGREGAARAAFQDALDAELRGRGRDLPDRIAAYETVAADHPYTHYGAAASLRAQALAWEIGRLGPIRESRERGW